MAAEQIPRNTARITTSLFAVALTIPLSVLTAAPARADSSRCDTTSNTGCVTLSSSQQPSRPLAPQGTVDLLNDGSADSNDLVVRTTGTVPDNQWGFKPNPNKDGSFQIVNHNADKNGCVEVAANGRLVVSSSCDPTNHQQLFYAEPINNAKANSYLIRHVDDNQCMTLKTPQTASEPIWMGLVGCAPGVGANNPYASNEEWAVSASPSAGAGGPTVDDLATLYALTQYNNKSGVLTSASYNLTDHSKPAYLGPYQVVSTSSDQGAGPVCRNSSGPSGGDLHCSMDWSQAMANSISQQDSIGITITLGPGPATNDANPLKAEAAIAYQHVWTESQTTTNTVFYMVSLPRRL